MIVIKPKIILTMDNEERILKDWFLGIENGKISYLDKIPPSDAEEIIELPDKIVIPGLINSHTHVAMTLLRGLKDDVDLITWLQDYIFPAEARLKGDHIYYGALLGMAEHIASGITTLNDMYYFEEKIAQASIEIGMRSVLSRGILDLVSEDRSPETEMKASKEFLDYLKLLWAKDEKLKDQVIFAFGPHAPYTCSKELLMKVKEEARKNRFKIHMHIAETKWEREEIKKRTGLTPVRYLDSFGFLGDDIIAIHVVWVDEEEIKILKERGVSVVHNPISNLKLASGFSPVPKMLENGVNVALGTDGPASNNRLDMFREMHVAALIHKGYNLDPKLVSAKEVMRMVTKNGAKALGLEDKIGSIEIGKNADLVFIDVERTLQAHPFHDPYSMIVYALDTSSVTDVMINGEWVYKDKKFTRIKIDKVIEKVEDIRKELLEQPK